MLSRAKTAMSSFMQIEIHADIGIAGNAAHAELQDLAALEKPSALA